jgi:hypothetical protein
MLPAPLQRLQSQYDQLVTAVESGHLTLDDALASLSNMAVVDGSGRQWSIDVEGRFTASMPGQPGQPADPVAFAADELPARPGSGDVPPWADPHLMGGTSPAGGPVGGPPWDGSGQHPGGPGTLPAEMPTPMGRRKHLGDEPFDGVGSTVKNASRKVSGSAAFSKLVGKLPGDKRLFAVLALAGLLVAGITGYNRMTDDPLADAGIDSGVPVTDPSGETPGLEQPTDGETGGEFPDDGSEAEPSTSTLPAGDTVTRALASLTSGDRTIAVEQMMSPGDPTDIALMTGSLSGLPEAGLAVTAGPASADDAGRVLQRWAIVDADTGVEYAQAQVTWVPSEDGWKVQTWPTFAKIAP